MQHKFFLKVMTIPTIAGSMLTMVLLTNTASASQIAAKGETNPQVITNSASCNTPPKSKFSTNKSLPVDDEILEFTEAESDAAVTLFGCDCPSCINALRQLQSKPLLETGQGHCWSALQEQNSPEQIQEVLQNLEEQEVNI